MPWSETTAMDQKIQFIRDWRRGRHTVTDLCAMYSISRKTGYKWLERCIEDEKRNRCSSSGVTRVALTVAGRGRCGRRADAGRRTS